MRCNKCGSPTEGINALCYQCQLDIMNKYLKTGREHETTWVLANEYNVRVATIMNILAYFGVLEQR